MDLRTEHRTELLRCLRDLEAGPLPEGDELAPLLQTADTTLEAHEAAAGIMKEYESACSQKRRATEELDRALADFATWKTEWGAAVQSLALQPDVRPAIVQSLIESYTELFAKLDEADSFRRRIYGIDQDIEEVEKSVRELAARVDPRLDSSDIVRCVGRLSDLLKRATADEASRLSLEQQERDLVRRLAEAATKRRQASEGLEALCREAGCQSPDQLDEAERLSAAFARLKEQLAELETAIVQAGEGVPLETLISDAEGINPDDLPPRLDRAVQDARAQELERARLLEEKGAEEAELRRMAGGSDAAAAADELQETLASLRGHVEHYLRVRAAAMLLRKEVERYREANQNPLLVRAGQLFRTLTLDSFHRIQTDVGPDDEPRLVGVRADGKLVSVEGMSSGTRDQLYLVLRLAALERFMETAEPMPLRCRRHPHQFRR